MKCCNMVLFYTLKGKKFKYRVVKWRLNNMEGITKVFFVCFFLDLIETIMHDYFHQEFVQAGVNVYSTSKQILY